MAPAATAADLNKAIPFLLDKRHIHNAVVAVIKPDQPIFTSSYDRNPKVAAVTAQTKFRLASLSKVVTAAAVNKLIENGKLQPTTTIFEIFNESDYEVKDKRSETITIQDLLNMTAGFDDRRSRDPVLLPFANKVVAGSADPFEATLKYVLRRNLRSAPGSKYAYSNFSYDLLAKIVEKKTAKDFVDFAREELGISSLTVARTALADLRDDEARYFTFEGDKLNPYTRANLEDHIGSIGLCATAADVALLAKNRHTGGATPGNRLQKPNLKRWSNSNKWFAGGWEVTATPAGYALFKDGSLPGTRTFAGVNPDGTAWAVLFNGRPKWKKGDPFGASVRNLMHDFKS